MLTVLEAVEQHDVLESRLQGSMAIIDSLASELLRHENLAKAIIVGHAMMLKCHGWSSTVVLPFFCDGPEEWRVPVWSIQ